MRLSLAGRPAEAGATSLGRSRSPWTCQVLAHLALVLALGLGAPAVAADGSCMLEPSSFTDLAQSDGYVDWPLARPDSTGELGFGHDVRIQQNYGNEDNEHEKPHTGMDLQWLPLTGEEYGTNTIDAPVYAAAGGEVFCVADDWGEQGWEVVVRHTIPGEGDVFTLYGHLNEPTLACGDRVERGQEIGTVQVWPRDPSNSHVHFEVRGFGEWTRDNRHCAGPGYRANPDEAGWENPVDFYYAHRPPYPRPVVTTSAWERNLRSDRSTQARPVRDRDGNPVVVPPATRLTARRVRRDIEPGVDNWWYRVQYQGYRGWINGYLWHEKASELAVGEPLRLGPGWVNPSFQPLIRYGFNDRTAFMSGLVPNQGSRRQSLDGFVTGDAQLTEGSSGGLHDSALELDGESGFVEVANSRLVNVFAYGLAVEAQIRRETNDDEDAVVGKWYLPDQWLLTVYPDGNGLLIFTVRLQDGTYESLKYPIPDDGYLGRWVRVGARAEAPGWLRLYWERRLVAQKLVGTRLIPLAPGDSPIHVGDAGIGTWWSRFHGSIDNVRIWSLR